VAAGEPITGYIVLAGHYNKNQEPEEACDYEQFSESTGITHTHEDPDDQGHLDNSNGDGDHDIELTHIEKCDIGGEESQNDERKPNQDIIAYGRDVMCHVNLDRASMLVEPD
jgi:hypothetical protein